MGELYRDFERELTVWRDRYRHQPRKELLKLLLLALEREQLVTVAYREDLMARRLDELDVPEHVRRVFRQCLAWAWRDEEMHAIFTRGLLLKTGSWTIRVRAFTQQLAGAIAGWASAVQQHVRWREAPLSRLVAAVVVFLGSLMGKVPRAIRKEMQYLSFRSFCVIQVDAERTAAAAWQRLTELAEQYPGVDERTRQAFERMWNDEERHREVFDLIATAIDDRGRLREGVDTDRLIQDVGAVGPYFLPRDHRPEPLCHNPLGQSGRVVAKAGATDADKLPTLDAALDAAGFDELVRERAQSLDKPIGDLRVVLKPTFMLGYDRRDMSNVTDPEIVAHLAERLGGLGVQDIAVGEGDTLYDAFFERRSVAEVADYFGYTASSYRVVDLTADQIPHDYPRGLAQHSISRTWIEADLRLSIPKMCSHPVDFARLSITGTQGVGARLEDYLFVERQADRNTAILMPLSDCPPHFALVDGFSAAGDGLVGIIGCPHAKAPRRFYAGADALAVDWVVLRHMGLADPREIGWVDAACHWFDDPDDDIEVIGDDEPMSQWRHPYHNDIASFLAFWANPAYLISGRGEIFLPAMDERAFPPRRRSGLATRGVRGVVRWLVGLRKPR